MILGVNLDISFIRVLKSFVKYHSFEFGDRLVHVPAVLGKGLGILEGKQQHAVRQGKRILLQFLEHCSSGMILLFVGKSQIPHVLAKNLDPVGILPFARGTTDFLDPTDDTQGHLDDVGRLSVDAAKVQLVIGDTEYASGWARVGTEVGDISGNALHSFAI